MFDLGNMYAGLKIIVLYIYSMVQFLNHRTYSRATLDQPRGIASLNIMESQLRAHPKIPQYIVSIYSTGGLKGALTWARIIPRDISLQNRLNGSTEKTSVPFPFKFNGI